MIYVNVQDCKLIFYYFYEHYWQAENPRACLGKQEDIMKASIVLAIGIGIAFSSAAQAQGANPAGESNLSHFLCYTVKTLSDPPTKLVTLADQFVKTKKINLKTPQYLCVPVSKNGERIPDPKTHLVCYTIPGYKAGKRVSVQHQLGKQVLLVDKTVTFCLPSTKTVLK